MPGESPFDFDFSTALQKIVGLKPDDSESALSQLSIDQLIDLIDALKAGDKRRVMHLIHPSHDRLPREMSPMQRDVQTESLIDEGFNYTLQAASDLIREKIMDWMDDHGYAFEAEPTGLLHVKCERRDDAYRIGRALETLTGRYLRDDDQSSSGPTLEAMMDHKNVRRKFRSNKMTIDTKPHNPLAKALGTDPMYRSKSAPSDEEMRREKSIKKDRFHRKGKHKRTPAMDEEFVTERFSLGDKVVTKDGTEATVKIPNGPGDTVGIVINGVLQMANERELDRVDEQVLGMSMMQGLQRMKQLAGLPISENDMTMGSNEVPNAADTGGLSLTQHDPSIAETGDEMDIVDMSGGDAAPPMGGAFGGGDMSAAAPEPMGAPPTPGLMAPPPQAPISPPSMPVGGGGEGGDALSSIQALLPELRLAEVKQLMDSIRGMVSESHQRKLAEAKALKRKKLTETRPARSKRKSFKDYYKG